MLFKTSRSPVASVNGRWLCRRREPLAELPEVQRQACRGRRFGSGAGSCCAGTAVCQHSSSQDREAAPRRSPGPSPVLCRLSSQVLCNSWSPGPIFMLLLQELIMHEGTPARMSDVCLQAISGAYMRGQLHAPHWRAPRSAWLPARAPCWRSCRPPSMQLLKSSMLAQLALQVCQAAPSFQASPVFHNWFRSIFMPVIYHSQSLHPSLAPFKPLLHSGCSFAGSQMKLHLAMLQQQAKPNLAQGT